MKKHMIIISYRQNEEDNLALRVWLELKTESIVCDKATIDEIVIQTKHGSQSRVFICHQEPQWSSQSPEYWRQFLILKLL